MSGSDAKTPEVAKLVGIFASLGAARNKDLEKQMKVKESSKVEGSQAEDATTSPKFEEVEEMGDQGDKDDEEPESYIQFLFDPEIPEVILNEYVIGEIGQFLEFDDLRSLRQVNKLWAAGITPAFVRKSAFVLRPGKRNQEQFEAFENDTKDLKGMTALKILIDFEFSYFGFIKEAEMFNDILAHLSPTLKSLELEAWLDAAIYIFLPRATIQLPALTTFIFTSRSVDKEIRHRLFQTLYVSAPNLTELDVLELDSAIISPLLVDDGSNCRNWALVPNLKSLRTRDHISSEELSTLSEFPQTWETFDIMVRTFGSRKNDTFQILAQLLENNKDSLVRLELNLNTHDFYRLVAPQTLRFPNTFSKLVELKLEFWDEKSIITFGGDRVYYSKTFPNLTSLSVKSGYNPDLNLLARFWIFLFPPQVFRGLKYLEVDSDGDYDQFIASMWMWTTRDWAENMFPNARTKFN